MSVESFRCKRVYLNDQKFESMWVTFYWKDEQVVSGSHPYCCVVLTLPSRNFCLLSVFGLGFLPLLCCRFTASFATLLKSWSTLRMSSLRACSRELPGCLMTSTKDLDMVLMMHSSMQSRKDFFASRGLLEIAGSFSWSISVTTFFWVVLLGFFPIIRMENILVK